MLPLASGLREGRKQWIKRNQHDWARQIWRRQAASAQPALLTDLRLIVVLKATWLQNRNVSATFDQEWGDPIIHSVHGYLMMHVTVVGSYNKVSLKGWLGWYYSLAGTESANDLNRMEQYHRKIICIYGRQVLHWFSWNRKNALKSLQDLQRNLVLYEKGKGSLRGKQISTSPKSWEMWARWPTWLGSRALGFLYFCPRSPRQFQIEVSLMC